MYYLRNRSQLFKGGFTLFLGLLFVIATLIDDVRGSLLPPSLACAGLFLSAWVFFFSPSMHVTSEGIFVRNWLRLIRVPWATYQGYKSRYGLVIVTEKKEYPVSSFPGSGGLSQGREQISEARRSKNNWDRNPWLKPSDSLQWASMKQARWALDSAAREVGAHEGPVPEKVRIKESAVSGPQASVTWNMSALAGLAASVLCFVWASFLIF